MAGPRPQSGAPHQQPAEPYHQPAQALSFDDWVTARGPALVRFAALVTGQPSDAPDVVQDVLIAIFPRWNRLQAAGTTEAYVRRAIVNRHISLWRSLGRREAPTADITFEAHRIGTDTRHTASDPTSALADADLAWRLCQRLPRLQRAAIVLRYYEDQSFAAIAEVLECTESTARSHVRRALAVLRGHLEEAAADD